MSPLYFDHATASPLLPQVIEVLRTQLDQFAAISAPYSLGSDQKKELLHIYQQTKNYLRLGENDQVVFTSNHAEAVSQIFSSVWYDTTRATGRNHFICSSLSQAPAVLAGNFFEMQGGKLQLAKTTAHAQVTADTLIDILSPRSVLVSIPWVCGLTGVIQQIAPLRALLEERGLFLHVDITHGLGKVHLDFEQISADYYTLGCAPLGGPEGGLLIAASSSPLLPLIFGQNEEFLRGGEPNIAQIKGCTQALYHAVEDEMLYCTEVNRLKGMLEMALEELGAKVLFQNEERVPHITAITFPHVKAEALLYRLQRQKVFATMGGGQFQALGIALVSCQVDPVEAECALSFALSKETSESDVQALIEIISKTYRELRRLSRVFFQEVSV